MEIFVVGNFTALKVPLNSCQCSDVRISAAILGYFEGCKIYKKKFSNFYFFIYNSKLHDICSTSNLVHPPFKGKWVKALTCQLNQKTYQSWWKYLILKSRLWKFSRLFVIVNLYWKFIVLLQLYTFLVILYQDEGDRDLKLNK